MAKRSNQTNDILYMCKVHRMCTQCVVTCYISARVPPIESTRTAAGEILKPPHLTKQMYQDCQ